MLDNHFLSNIGVLNRDIFRILLQCLTLCDFLNARLVSRFWQVSSQDAVHWQKRIVQHFPYLLNKTPLVQTQPKALFFQEIKRIQKEVKKNIPVYTAIKFYLLASLRGEIENISQLSLAQEAKNELYIYGAANGHQAACHHLNAIGKEKALYLAAENGYLCALRTILLNTFEANVKGKALESAAKNGFLEVVQALLAHENDTISSRVKGEALKAAARNGHLAVLHILLLEKRRGVTNHDIGLALVYAAREGYLEIIQALCQRQTISAVDKGEALMCAAIAGHVAIVQFLLIQYEDSLSQEAKGRALMSAVMNKREEAVKMILKQASSGILAQNKVQALNYAACQGDVLMVHILLPLIGDNLLPRDKGDVLIGAARNGHLAVVQVLLTFYGEEILSWYINLALFLAAEKGRTTVVQALLTQASCVIDSESKEQALINAARRGWWRPAHFILTHCHEISLAAKGKSLVAAARNGHLVLVQIVLAQFGEEISVSYKSEALKYALQKRHRKIAQLLFAHVGKSVFDYFKEKMTRGAEEVSNEKQVETLAKSLSCLAIRSEKKKSDLAHTDKSYFLRLSSSAQTEVVIPEQPLIPPSAQSSSELLHQISQENQGFIPKYQQTIDQNASASNTVPNEREPSSTSKESKSVERHVNERMNNRAALG